MKNLVEFLSKEGYVFKMIIHIDNSYLQIRKKIKIYTGTTLMSEYVAIFILNRKSKILVKNAKEILEIYEILKTKRGHNYKKKILLYNSNICSKAKKFMIVQGWRLYAFV